MIQQLLSTVASDPPIITVDAAFFDGTNDWMERGADFTGNADSKKGIFSAWIKYSDTSASRNILVGTGNKVLIRYSFVASDIGKFQIIAANSASTQILSIATSNSSVYSGAWFHLLASWDLATTTTHLYMKDVSDQVTTTVTNDTIDYTIANYAVCANIGGTTRHHGDIAEIYFAPGQYLDFSITGNRRKFISSTLKPVSLGPDGAGPTGVAPILYCHLADAETAANFATNRGTGGDVTITGTLTTSSTSPSD
jgi:hypothetical protein